MMLLQRVTQGPSTLFSPFQRHTFKPAPDSSVTNQTSASSITNQTTCCCRQSNSVGCQVNAAVRVIKLTLRQGQGCMMCFVANHFSVAGKSSMYLNGKILYNYQL